MPFVSINKPLHLTSHDVIQTIRRVTGIKKVGHAGTLDPLASGVLVVAIGRDVTQQIGTLVDQDKEYEAEITLGVTSETDDAEGPLTTQTVVTLPSLSQLQSVLSSFVGTIQQLPPLYSSIKNHGQTAHSLARKHQRVILGPRTVTIHSIHIQAYLYPLIHCRVHTGSGVYIRSLARDLGAALGTGGYLSALVRTRVGNYSLATAIPLADFPAYWTQIKGITKVAKNEPEP